MSKFIVAAAVLTLAACGPKPAATPAADSMPAAAPAPAPAPAATDTAKVAGDTSKAH